VPPQERITQAIALMVVYVSMIVFVNAGGKLLAEFGYHPLQIVLFRHGVAFLFMLVLFLPRQGMGVLRARRPGMQVLRGMCAIFSSIFYFWGLVSVSLATAAAISFTMPLLVVAASGPLLGERVGLHRWAAVAAGFCGALVIIRPGIGDAAQWGALLLLGSAGCGAVYQILTRRLAGQDRAETMNIWSGMVGSVIVSAMVPFVWRMPGEAIAWALFIGLGLIGGYAHYLLAKAFERGPASLLSPFNYLQLLGATFTGYALFGQLPDAFTWLGAAIIVAAGLYVARRERARAA
jgi:drug/metabolite transporter (DMT)-like permease